MKIDRSNIPGTRGFTILELMLSIAVFVVLVTSAFSLLVATTELIAEISELEAESANQLRFVETCRFAFEEMTAESGIEFDYVERALSGRRAMTGSRVSLGIRGGFMCNPWDPTRNCSFSPPNSASPCANCGPGSYSDRSIESSPGTTWN